MPSSMHAALMRWARMTSSGDDRPRALLDRVRQLDLSILSPDQRAECLAIIAQLEAELPE
jgi:hypothetical protein